MKRQSIESQRLVSCVMAVFAFAVFGACAQEIDPATGVEDIEMGVVWYDALALGVEGQGWSEVKEPYDRLPARAEGVVTDGVWGLQKHSAGLCVRFKTDSKVVAARWKLRNADLAMNHMAATGVSGLDLYARGDDGWHWAAVGRPQALENTAKLLDGIPDGEHEFLLYLPLYNGIESLSIGVSPDAVLSRSPQSQKPIVVYGTSITQGGCAARPGMAYPAILGRWLDRPSINLGFSGNGRAEPETVRFLAELDPAVFVIDTGPNMKPEWIAERLEPMVRALRAARPDTPIVLVENIVYQQSWFMPGSKSGYETKNAEWRGVYDRLIADGVTGLHYVPCESLLGNDFEGTVDGTHPTDLGFLRMAEALAPVLRELIK